jgi:hypothetical protein
MSAERQLELFPINAPAVAAGGSVPSLDEVYETVRRNAAARGTKDFYAPLPDEESRLIRADYARRVRLPLEGDASGLEPEFLNASGTVVARGYVRVVVGDYGAYLEFSPEQICMKVLRSRIPGTPKRPVKYLWFETDDGARTKVYAQQAEVRYADYRPGFYYASPGDLHIPGLDVLYEPRKSGPAAETADRDSLAR